MSTKRLFFGLWPDDRQRDRLRDIINSVARNVEGKAEDRRNWHITLAWIGDFPEEKIPELARRAAEIEVQPFRLGFDRLEFWARAKVAVLTAPTIPTELQALVDSLTALLLDFGVTTQDRTYRPHITVSRRCRSFTTERLAQRSTTEWSSFELMESEHGPRVTTYAPLKQ